MTLASPAQTSSSSWSSSTASRFRSGSNGVPLDVPTILRLTGQVADALDEAHGLGIIHRDIKSANLLLTQRGRIKILDFGLAKTLGTSGLGADEPTLAETQLGTVVGTVSYMSPEQALGQEVDHRSDLFSLGVVMYEGLTGRLPFVGKTLAAVVDQILRQEPPALARLNYDVPARLQDIVRKLLAKTTSNRYQSAKGAADRPHHTSEGSRARRKPARKQRWIDTSADRR